jgi:glycosyltransferase involved in cell wall biosynthesis
MRAVSRRASRARIGFDLRRMHRTGIGRYARNIFTAVSAEASEHEYVAVVQNDADATWARAVAPTADVVVAPAAHYSPREMLRTPALTRPVDLWHSPHPYQWAVGARHRTVLTLLDLIQVTHAVGALNLLAREPLRLIIWAACRRAHSFVAISAATRDAFHEEMGVPVERIHVTPLAPDPRFAEPVDPCEVQRARTRWGLPERTVVYVGMTQPHKNLDGLLRALALIAHDRPGDPIALAVIGPVVASRHAALLDRVRALGIADRVRFLGWLPDEEVRIAYHLASVVALPSLAEGFGLTMLEAMQCGSPCVASDIPALREVADGAARLVDPRDPASIAAGLRDVLDDSALADCLRTRGRANAARFSWKNAARTTLAAYDAAMGAES